MPSIDTSLKFGLMQAGIPAGFADDIAIRIAAQPLVVAAVTSGTIAGAAITASSINSTPVGQTTPAPVRASNLGATTTDVTSTPGSTTANTPKGRAAFAATSASVTLTNSLVTATSSVFVQLGGADATLVSVRVTPGAGTFTVTGNAAATGTTPFDFLVVT